MEAVLLLLIGGGLLWVLSRKPTSVRDVVPYEGPPPARKASTLQALLPTEEAPKIVREGLFGGTEAGEGPVVRSPWDLLSEGGLGLPSLPGLPAVPGLFAGGEDVLPGLPTASASRAVTPVKLSSEYAIDPYGGDLSTPAKQGQRVTFDLTRKTDASSPSHVATLEGFYYGPESDFTREPSSVVVDRVAELVEGSEPPLGRYTIPESKYRSSNGSLSTVKWKPLDPDQAGLTAVVSPPVLKEGDWLTLVAKDTFGNVAVWLGIVQNPIEGGYDVTIVKFYRMITNKGGKQSPTPPKYLDEATVPLLATQLVNPKSIPTEP